MAKKTILLFPVVPEMHRADMKTFLIEFFQIVMALKVIPAKEFGFEPFIFFFKSIDVHLDILKLLK